MARSPNPRDIEEVGFFAAIDKAVQSQDEQLIASEMLGEELLIYADWLEDRADPAAALVRHHHYMLKLSPGNSILKPYVKEEQSLRQPTSRIWWRKYEKALGFYGDILHWKRLYSRRNVMMREGERVDVRDDLSHSIRVAESQLAFRFPRAYRAFLFVFGACELAHHIRICGPYAKPSIYNLWDIAIENAVLQKDDRIPPEFIGEPRPYILFGFSEAGDRLFWVRDNTDVDADDKAGDESPIVYRNLDDETGGTVEVADTFRQFVRNFCFGKSSPIIGGLSEPSGYVEPIWTCAK